MSDGPEWFAPKRYGYGAGLPISWQGWLVLSVFLGICFVVSIAFKDRPLVTVAIMAPVIATFLVIVARTTKGGWRWRWGEED
jgi:hypothetical protein